MLWSYPCACSPGGPQGTANDCQHVCATCGHKVAMHNSCRYRCFATVTFGVRCECQEVTGTDMPAYEALWCKERTERNHEIWARRKRGETYSSIAADYDIGRERARQIFMKVERKKASERAD